MDRVRIGPINVRPVGNDPYKSFRFRIKSDGRVVAGFSKCTGLTTSAAKPARVRLERGITCDHNFDSWIEKPAETWRTSKHKDLVVEIYNEAGGRAEAHRLNDCWVTRFQGIADLDANSREVITQMLELDHLRRVRT